MLPLFEWENNFIPCPTKWEYFWQCSLRCLFNHKVSVSYLSWIRSEILQNSVSALLSFCISSGKMTRTGVFPLILVPPFRSLKLPFIHGNINFQSRLCAEAVSQHLRHVDPLCLISAILNKKQSRSLSYIAKTQTHSISYAHKVDTLKLRYTLLLYEVLSQFTPTYCSPTHT